MDAEAMLALVACLLVGCASTPETVSVAPPTHQAADAGRWMKCSTQDLDAACKTLPGPPATATGIEDWTVPK
ncbi:MAG: hypothetical protein ABSE49_19955 [Polyangiaceae bacterium]